ncbi:MAG: hypothetical protein P8X70_02075 [Nanoarchaeota archaeon]
MRKSGYKRREIAEEPEEKNTTSEEIELSDEDKEKLKELSQKNQGSGKAILLDSLLEEIKQVSVRGLNNALRRSQEKPSAIVIDGTVTSSIIKTAEESHVQVIVAKNFATTDTDIKLLSL